MIREKFQDAETIVYLFFQVLTTDVFLAKKCHSTTLFPPPSNSNPSPPPLIPPPLPPLSNISLLQSRGDERDKLFDTAHDKFIAEDKNEIPSWPTSWNNFSPFNNFGAGRDKNEKTRTGVLSVSLSPTSDTSPLPRTAFVPLRTAAPHNGSASTKRQKQLSIRSFSLPLVHTDSVVSDIREEDRTIMVDQDDLQSFPSSS